MKVTISKIAEQCVRFLACFRRVFRFQLASSAGYAFSDSLLFGNISNRKRYSIRLIQFSLDSRGEAKLDFGPTIGLYSVYNLNMANIPR